MLTAPQTALLLCVMLQRSGHKRARLSKKNIAIVAKRKRLPNAFIVALRDAMEDYGVALLELQCGAFGIIYSETLAGARIIQPTLLDETERLSPDFAALDSELNYQRPDFSSELD